jgi:N-acetylglucosamine kinase-like BadF-type ATPase
MIVAGVDGGATRTRVILTSDDGTILGGGLAGPTNYDNVGIDEARSNLDRALERAWKSSHLARRPVQAIFLGMAGVVSPQDRATINRMALDIHAAPEGGIAVDHDIRIALAGGLAGQEGAVLIVGTGCSCYGRRTDGRNHRTGWGYLLDDVGSGYYLGLQAMIALTREADGRGKPTRLSASVRRALGFEHADDIMRILYHDNLSVTQIASLAPQVLEAADGGDEVALAILRNGARELSLNVKTVADRLEFTTSPFLVTIVGGLGETPGIYRRLICDAITHELPGCTIVEPRLPPVLGAALLAMGHSGHAPAPSTIQRLAEGATHITWNAE